MVVHRKDTKKQNKRKLKENFFFYETSFLHELIILKIASNALQNRQKKDIKKET